MLKTANPKCVRENSALDSPFSADEVFKGIAQLKNKKASGNDLIGNEMIKTGSPTILPFLVTLFNTTLEIKSYPEDWFNVELLLQSINQGRMIALIITEV